MLVGACQTSLGCCANLHPANLPSVHVCTEVRSGDVHEPLQLAAGDKVTFTIVEGADGSDNRVSGGRGFLPLFGSRVFQGHLHLLVSALGSGICLMRRGSAIAARAVVAQPPCVAPRLANTLAAIQFHFAPIRTALHCTALYAPIRSAVNYDDFISDASVGDMLLVDGGIMSMEVKAITDTGGRVGGRVSRWVGDSSAGSGRGHRV